MKIKVQTNGVEMLFLISNPIRIPLHLVLSYNTLGLKFYIVTFIVQLQIFQQMSIY